MKTTYDLLHHVDTQNTHLNEATRDVLERRYGHLQRLHPELLRAEAHLSAQRGQSEVHLLVHDSRHRLIEAHAQGRRLNEAIVRCFARIERQLEKPKQLRRAA